MIVVAYGLLLPAAVLSIPRLGCINIHASLLPRWRGAAPIQRAILAGDKETGVTIMQMDAGLDTGPMLRQVRCSVHTHDTAKDLHDRLADLGAEALLISLADLEAGSATAVAQNNIDACYAPKIAKPEAEIDWQQSAEHLDRLIRAFNPWPVAFTQLAGQTVRIWQAEVAGNTRQTPGTVISATKQGIDIATSDGILRLLTLQLPGGKPLPAGDIINNQIFQGGLL